MLSFAGKERSPYSGMSDEMKDVIIAADELEQKMEVLVTDAEIEAAQAEDKVHSIKVKKILDNLNKKYGDRLLTKPEFMYESGYGESKTKDFLAIYGSFDIGLIALRIVADAKDNAIRDDNHKRLTHYLSERYKGFQGVPIECLEMECQEDSKVVLKQAKKLMGLTPKARLEFVPATIVVDIIMEDLL